MLTFSINIKVGRSAQPKKQVDNVHVQFYLWQINTLPTNYPFVTSFVSITFAIRWVWLNVKKMKMPVGINFWKSFTTRSSSLTTTKQLLFRMYSDFLRMMSHLHVFFTTTVIRIFQEWVPWNQFQDKMSEGVPFPWRGQRIVSCNSLS